MINSLKECRGISNSLCSIISSVLSKIKPDNKEREYILSFVERIIREIKNALSDLEFPFRVEVHGSIAHDTWLKNDRDIDIFILLQKELSKNFVEENILKRIEKRLPYTFERRYAEHPYLRTRINEFEIDIVPGFDVGKIISAVDRTPFHTEFLMKNLTQELKDEVRLLKVFLKGIGAYGAEIKIGGFSGYACELLIVYFKSFLKTVNAFAKQKRIFIDFTNSWKEKKAFQEFNTPIIIIDPVDKKRNVTASITFKTFDKIKLASKIFLERPSIEFFYPAKKSIDMNQLEEKTKKRAVMLILLKKEENISPDTYWGQIRRTEQKIVNFLKKFPELEVFAVESFENENNVMICIETNKLELSNYIEIKGPPVWANTGHILEFINKHKEGIEAGPWIKNGRIVYLRERRDEEKRLARFLEQFMQKLRLNPSFKHFIVIDEPQKILECVKNQKLENELMDFLVRRYPWLTIKDDLKK